VLDPKIELTALALNSIEYSVPYVNKDDDIEVAIEVPKETVLPNDM
jgi:hypothetical protein